MSASVIRLQSSQLLVEILPVGASVRSVRFDGLGFPLVVGLEDRDLYGPRNKPFFGATIGRNANRIAGGRLPIEGVDYQLSLNEPPNHLHGGTNGAWSREWEVENVSSTDATLTLHLADGEDGYPGAADLTAIFAAEDDMLTIVYEATVTRTSAVNMTSHLYFNLSGEPDTRDHCLEIAADRYLPVGETLIPTGEAVAVEGTPFDFRNGRVMRNGPDLLDHNFCLARERVWTPRPAARLFCETSGVAVEIATTECGLQTYDGSYLDGSFRGLGGRPIGKYGAIAIEPQNWPDAPNHPDFPSSLLHPGERYRHESVYRFTRG
ncbi:aldose epimerase family protein [Aureimonas leprariae]|uniref:Galactose mutarotase n=1 Tax=Plantimonas leprariae TaxID=2615207 RepID=A0A7V7TZN2_9HYPH|nr:aldose epimerase family protein [Aureimonas leprariae]KAB0679626.1 galactose mutarotase [Aureimonas leprariae]